MRNLIATLSIAVLLLGTAACGGTEEDQPAKSGGGENAAPEEAIGGGVTFENAVIKVVLPEGWTVFDDFEKVNMMRIYGEEDTSRFAPTIHLKFEGKVITKLTRGSPWTGDPNTAIDEIAKKHGGSTAEKEVLGGVEFYKTTYEYGKQKQTLYIAKKGEMKITLTAVGRGYDEVPEIQAILEAITYK